MARIVSKFIAVLVIAVILTIAVNRYKIRCNHTGKDAYMAAESRRFDRYYARPHAFPVWPALVFTTGLVITYELVAFGAYKAIRAFGFSDDLKRHI